MLQAFFFFFFFLFNYLLDALGLYQLSHQGSPYTHHQQWVALKKIKIIYVDAAGLYLVKLRHQESAHTRTRTHTHTHTHPVQWLSW